MLRFCIVWMCAAVVWTASWCVATNPVLAEPTFPALTGRIVDEARLLSPADRAEIEAVLRELEAKSSDQLVVLTTPSLQGYDIADFGYRLGRHWKLGQAGTNNGVVLIVAPNERKVRIEVGRGLEGQMTDVLSSVIIQNALLPAFRRGDMPAGIKAAVRDIKDVLLGDADAVRERARSLQPRTPEADWLPLLVIVLIVAVWFWMTWQARSWPTANQRRRRFGKGRVIVVPGGWGGSGDWSGGSGGGDGGFSGGGGDFGGGGASGSW